MIKKYLLENELGEIEILEKMEIFSEDKIA